MVLSYSLSLWCEYAELQHSLVRRPLGTKGMNVKILADSKSHLQEVALQFKTHTKCFPRSPNTILANHPTRPWTSAATYFGPV